jgi:acetoin utilization deacetylase AcuC-like enzyme
VSDAGFARMATAVALCARELAAPCGLVLEGGYALGALARGVATTMGALTDGGSRPADAEPDPLALEARARLARWWPDLG